MCVGNDNLHLMTTDRRQRLRVDLADWDGHTTYAEYDNFIVGSAQYRYALYSLGVYRGYAGELYDSKKTYYCLYKITNSFKIIVSFNCVQL